MHNNCYLLRCTSTGAQALIDAADDAERLLRLIGPQLVTAVITTHSHWDHHRALATVVDETAAVTVAGAPDAQEITNQTGVKVDLEVNDGDIVSVGDRKSTRLNSSHVAISYAVFCLKKKKNNQTRKQHI